jgi:hypothetical protein
MVESWRQPQRSSLLCFGTCSTLTEKKQSSSSFFARFFSSPRIFANCETVLVVSVAPVVSAALATFPLIGCQVIVFWSSNIKEKPMQIRCLEY